MKNILTTVTTLLFFGLILFLVFAIDFTAIGGIVYFMGWLVRLVVPLNLFESLVISSLLTGMTVIVTRVILNFFSPLSDSISSPFSSNPNLKVNEPEITKIVSSRFYKSATERTWEAWFNYEIANDIYADFQLDPEPIRTLNDTQRQELAIRLATLSVSILKRKSPGSRNLEINANALRREMERIGQKVYDLDLLEVAVDATNANVDYYADELATVIRDRSWNQIAIDLDE